MKKLEDPKPIDITKEDRKYWFTEEGWLGRLEFIKEYNDQLSKGLINNNDYYYYYLFGILDYCKRPFQINSREDESFKQHKIDYENFYNHPYEFIINTTKELILQNKISDIIYKEISEVLSYIVEPINVEFKYYKKEEYMSFMNQGYNWCYNNLKMS